MHPFQRLSRYIPSRKSASNPRKDTSSTENSDRQNDRDSNDDDQSLRRDISRKTSPSRRKEEFQDERDAQYSLQPPSIPIIQIATCGGSPDARLRRKSANILKAKEQALWSNSSTERDDNSERLGPNKNSIIQESLMCKK